MREGGDDNAALLELLRCLAEPPRVEHHLAYLVAAGNPHAYVRAKAGHSQSTITDRDIHAAQVLFPGAAEKAEARTFGAAG